MGNQSDYIKEHIYIPLHCSPLQRITWHCVKLDLIGMNWTRCVDRKGKNNSRQKTHQCHLVFVTVRTTFQPTRLSSISKQYNDGIGMSKKTCLRSGSQARWQPCWPTLSMVSHTAAAWSLPRQFGHKWLEHCSLQPPPPVHHVRARAAKTRIYLHIDISI